MKVAALDLGSNTFLCLIAEVDKKQIAKVYFDEVEVVRLGQGLAENKKFHPEALARAKNCLSKFAKAIAEHKPEKVLAVATAAARTAENKKDLEDICHELKIPLEIISGDREAECTFLGAVSHLPDPRKVRAVIDVGGGSTEIIVGSIDRILFQHSFPVGAVKLTEKFISSYPPQSQMMQNLDEELKRVIVDIPEHVFKSIKEVVAVAGTPTELAKVEVGGFDPEKINGYTFSQEQLTEWAQKFSTRTPQEIEENFGVSKGRSDVMFVGTNILKRSLQALNQQQMTVSTRGIRYGVAISL